MSQLQKHKSNHGDEDEATRVDSPSKEIAQSSTSGLDVVEGETQHQHPYDSDPDFSGGGKSEKTEQEVGNSNQNGAQEDQIDAEYQHTLASLAHASPLSVLILINATPLVQRIVLILLGPDCSPV